MQTTEISTPHLALLALKARSVAQNFPDVEAEDIFQELTAFWLENYQRLKADGEEAVGLKDYVEAEDAEWGKNLLNKSLERAGNVYARRVTAQIRGHDDFAQYSRRSVTMMLPQLLDVTSWSSYAAPEPGHGPPRLANESGNIMAIYADLTAAWNSLGIIDQTLLTHRYILGGDWMPDCLELLETENEGSVRSRVSKALTRLVRHLAGRQATHVYSERRRSMSNAAAQSLTRENYG